GAAGAPRADGRGPPRPRARRRPHRARGQRGRGLAHAVRDERRQCRLHARAADLPSARQLRAGAHAGRAVAEPALGPRHAAPPTARRRVPWTARALGGAAAASASRRSARHRRQAGPAGGRRSVRRARAPCAEPRFAVRREPRGERPRRRARRRLDAARALRRRRLLALPLEPRVARRQSGQPRDGEPRRGARAPAPALAADPAVSGVLAGYLRRRVAARTLALVFFFTALMQVLELLDVTTDVLDRGLGATGLAYYAALRLPSEVLLALPLAALLGAMWAFSELARSHEMIPIRASGVSPRRMIAWLLPVPFAVALAQVVLAQAIVPVSEATLKSWWDASAPADETPERSWVRTSSGPVSFLAAAPDGRRLTAVHIYVRGEDDLLTERISARTAQWTGEAWRLDGVEALAVDGVEAIAAA